MTASQKSNSPASSEKVFSFGNAFFLVGIPLIAIALTPWAYRSGGLTLGVFVYALIHYILEGLSITAGYHRLFAHRSYQANPLVKFFVLLFGAGAMQNSALSWATDHRIHHKHEDTEKDPYNIKKGFWWAHIGWIFYASSPTNVRTAPADLQADRMLMFQHKYYLLIALSMWFGLPLIFGYYFNNIPGFLVVGALWRVLWTSHCTYLINSAAHVFGKATYSLDATARDNWFLAFFTFGEGYHNFHHKFQADYRNGIKWYQFDPTKWLILAFRSIGLASNLNKISDERILLAKMKTKQQILQQKGINTESLIPLTQKMEMLLEEFRGLRYKIELNKKVSDQKQASELIAELTALSESYLKEKKKVYKQWTNQWRDLLKVRNPSLG